GGGFLGNLQSAGSCAWEQLCVGVDKKEPGVLGFLRAKVDRVVLSKPAAWNFVCFKHPEVRNLRRQGANYFRGFVRGLVIDDQDLGNFGLKRKRMDTRRD